MDWPADIEIAVDGQILERVEIVSPRSVELGQAGLGYYDYFVSVDVTPARWDVVVAFPDARRAAGSLRIAATMILRHERSSPLVVPIRDNTGELNTKLDGRAVFDIPDVPLFAKLPTVADVTFRDSGSEFVLTLPSTTQTNDTPVGPTDTTVTIAKGGSGTFDWTTGQITVPATFDVKNTNLIIGNSTVDVVLSTDALEFPAGRVLEAHPMQWNLGETLELKAVGKLKGGYLDGKQVLVSIAGVLGAFP